jgi:hypothetical protein
MIIGDTQEAAQFAEFIALVLSILYAHLKVIRVPNVANTTAS